MRDTSLDEFIGEGGDGESGDGEDDEVEDGDAGAADDETADTGAESPGGGEDDVQENGVGDGRNDVDGTLGDDEFEPEEVQPAVSTYDWTPDGASCAECDVVVERRWRDDGVLVCVDCKDW